MYSHYNYNNNFSDFYKTLNISYPSTPDVIKKAYRSMSMKYHPDRNPNNPEYKVVSQKINEAYEVLSDVTKRYQYDKEYVKMINNKKQNDTIRENQNKETNKSDNVETKKNKSKSEPEYKNEYKNENISSLFCNFLKSQTQIINNSENVYMIPKINHEVTIQFENIFKTQIIPISIERWIHEENKKVFETETIYIEIPQGIDNNETIIIQNKGNFMNGQKGDIVVRIKIENRSQFQREGLDLILYKNITLKESLCGLQFTILHPNGKRFKVTNKKGILVTNGFKKELSQFGITRVVDSVKHTGNLKIIFNVIYPESLTEEQINKLCEIL